MTRHLLFLSLCLASLCARAQEYHLKQYRVEKGLPSDVVKQCVQDSLGYFWIATDEGLVKYDGVKFTSYRGAMRSNYAKGFLTTRRGRLLAFGDLDLIEIKNGRDTVVFEQICPVSRFTSDTAVSYPKILFEDAAGAIWVSESQAVVRLDGKKIKRYSFDLANRSPQFLRAFSFFEDAHQNLFTVSFQGNVFRYDVQSDQFESFKEKFPPDVEHVSDLGDRLVIGTAEGLSEANFLPEGGFKKPVLTLKIPAVSFVAALSNGHYFIATRGRAHFIADLNTHATTALPFSINNINHVYLSKENDIWLSGSDGLMILQENLFQNPNPKLTEFVESIAEDPATKSIYAATAHTLYRHDPVSGKNTVELDIAGGYFQSLLYTPDGLWIANAFKVFLFKDGKIVREFDFTKSGRFITRLTKDSNNNVWLTIPGSDYAYAIDTKQRLKRFRVALGKEGVINAIYEGTDGMYIASAGIASYLFFKPAADTVFTNISVPPPFKPKGEFNVTDLVMTKEGLWIASTEGLLKRDGGKFVTVNLGEHFAGLPVKSLYVHPGNRLLASTAYGMILYNPATGAQDLFNESSGLLSNTITPQGLFVSGDGKIWAGTSKGLCYSTRSLTRLSLTPRPIITRFVSNGKKISPDGDHEIAYGSFVTIEVSSLTFPENELTVQYRLQPDTTWITSGQFEIQFAATQSGQRALEVRTKKNGPYAWSNPSLLKFVIAQPFWKRPWFYVLVILSAALLVMITIAIVSARARRRTMKLQTLIDERTTELKKSNENLISLNTEKNNLIGIVAHDLKSPLQQIMGFLTLIKMSAKTDDQTTAYLTMIQNSASRLNDMVGKILDMDALDSKQLVTKIERVNLSALLSSVAERFGNDAEKKEITIQQQIPPEIFASADVSYLEQVFENLISNALKFSPKKRDVHVNLITAGKKVVCEVRDEGPGLTEADQKKLFGKYQKLSARPTGNEISTGLGLSIVKKFVTAMNGEVWCVCEKGHGASFFVTMPLSS